MTIASPRLRPSTLVVLGLAALAMPGCADMADDGLDGLAMSGAAPMVSLPPQAGRIIGISETRSGSTITQTIALQADPSTQGQNQLVVTMRRSGPVPRISSDGIAAELAAAMPGVPMA